MFANAEPATDVATAHGAAFLPQVAQPTLVIDMIPQIVWVASPDGAIEYFNRRAREYTGQDLQRYCGGRGGWAPLVHPDDVEAARQAWDDLLLDETPGEWDMRISAADGRFRWHHVTVAPVRDADGPLTCWMGTCIDIEEHRGSRDAGPERANHLTLDVVEARQDHEFRSVVMDHMAEGLYTADDTGRVTSVNRAAAHMLGWEQDELLGRSLQDILLLPDGSDPSAAPAGRVLSSVLSDGERGPTADAVYVRRDGSPLPVTYSAAPLQVGPTATGVVVVFRDVSELRLRQQRELESSHDQKLESLGRLSAGLAHEINTPIQFVGDNTRFLAEAYQQMLELLLVYRECISGTSGGLSWEERKQRAEAGEEKADIDYLASEVPAAVEQSLEGIERVASLVRAMKAFSYKDSTERGYADLNEAIRTTITVARNEVKYVADVLLDLGELPQVLCHLGDLNQVFLNLLVNSADAMQDKGERGRITVTTRADGDHAVISFADDGSGIPPELQKTIFEPFFTTKEIGKGTGQGLALARAVCEKHGGSIEVHSDAGQGTEFILRLPVAGNRTGPA